jgi:two-component system LytT family response regulator
MAATQILQIPTVFGKEQIDCQHIVRVDGSRNYSIVTLADGRKLLLAKTLRLIESYLPSHFVRTHKSVIVNVKCIKAIRAKSVLLTNGSVAAIALRRHKNVKAQLYSQEQ